MSGRVTIFRFDGGDAAIETARSMDDQVRDFAVEHGAVAHFVARDGDDVIVINVWSSAEGSDAMAADPRVREVLAQHGFDGPPPNREHYDVVYSMLTENPSPAGG
jgi:hypothetical protein